MRRLLTSLTALSLLLVLVGCDHMVGVCDCVGPGDACIYGHGPGNPITPIDWRALAVGHPLPPAEAGAMPKADEKPGTEVAPPPEPIPAPGKTESIPAPGKVKKEGE
jgi:hypothetical protein